MNGPSKKVILLLPVQSVIHLSRTACLDPFRNHHSGQVEIVTWKLSEAGNDHVAEANLVVSPNVTELSLRRVDGIRKIRPDLPIFAIAGPKAAERLVEQCRNNPIVTLFCDVTRENQAEAPEGLPLLTELYQRACAVLGITAKEFPPA